MKISMTEQGADASLSGSRELWVQVLSNEMVDLPRVKAAVDEEGRGIWSRYMEKPSDFYPHWVTKDEEAEHGYRFEDWFIFPARPNTEES